jgi:hypothetical protein
VACSFRNVEDDFTWAFVGVYSPNIGSDFNVTRFPSERSSEARFSPLMTEFSDFISEQGFMDLPLVGESSTWSNNSC